MPARAARCSFTGSETDDLASATVASRTLRSTESSTAHYVVPAVSDRAVVPNHKIVRTLAYEETFAVGLN